jgi:tryptophanase
MQHRTIIEPFRIKSVEAIQLSTEKERIQYLKEARYNPFLLRSDNVIIDLLTDSGTSAMSARQWAGMMAGDEAYAGSRSWLRMQEAVQELTGMEHILPTHQGRAAERILYGHLGGPGKIFISNTHFDTTRANIEFSGATAIDIPIAEGRDTSLIHPFKGNMDVAALDHLLKEHKGNVGAVILTVTNNSGGGQPVSMANAEGVAAICKRHGVLFLLDCCRIAENSWFVKHREEGMDDLTYRHIAQKMFSLADGAVMSAKKDALVNMGGFLALRDEALAAACTNLLIITEGFTTYGGLSGRDMEAIAIGLDEVFEPGYLNYRIKSTTYLGNKLHEMGVPFMLPIGGHAVYIDVKKLYPHIPPDQYSRAGARLRTLQTRRHPHGGDRFGDVRQIRRRWQPRTIIHGASAACDPAARVHSKPHRIRGRDLRGGDAPPQRCAWFEDHQGAEVPEAFHGAF